MFYQIQFFKKTMKYFLFFFMILVSNITNQNTIGIDGNQSEDYVPDENTAIKIAEAIWLPIYGEEIFNNKPFRAKLSDNGEVWIVKGTLPKGMFGGFPIIELRKKDCKVLKVSHSK